VRIVLFCHSLISDWNHGNAHFLRGIARELIRRGHLFSASEPEGGWSVTNLRREHGDGPEREFRDSFPDLRPTSYSLRTLDLDEALDGADLVLVHEWNEPELVRRLGRRRAEGGRFVLLFHDTHHRSVTAPQEMAAYELDGYDGVLAFGEVIREIYLRRGWARRVWTWHEAADSSVFYPREAEREGELIWIGNWGDGERAAELDEFLIEPVRKLALRARIHGVRYPPQALHALAGAGIEYGGWLANHKAPAVYARYAFTVHVPRRPYASALPGIPTIRVFEALACGIPLVSAPWDDAENLFQPGTDFLVARDGAEMTRRLGALREDPDMAAAVALRGLESVLARHTCRHRADELLEIYRGIADKSDEQTHEHRLLRLEPGFGILERGGHVLPRPDPGA
jgi:spore maturation protein CgeB